MHASTKSWNGCWTCRVRHKKCDETFPQCQTCSSLLITCYYTEEKPEWMDNGERQQDMVNRLKLEVKEKASMRRAMGYIREAEERQNNDSRGSQYLLPHRGPNNNARITSQQQSQAPAETPPKPQPRKVWPGCDAGFMSYYLDFFFPFLFPFYRPHMLEGGRSWLLEFLNEAEGMQQSAMAFSSYLFTIVLDASEAGHEFCININWDKMLAEMSNTFTGLKNEVALLGETSMDSPAELSRAVRILGVITHLQRFEIATSGFANCKMHLDAAVQAFKTILGADVANSHLDVGSRFFQIMAHLGPSPWPKPYLSYQITSPEQVAFRFFASLLVADDIIASTSLGEEPRLYHYHAQLMADEPENQSAVDLEVITGCQNGVMQQIGEISFLAAWKRRQRRQDDAMALELARRGASIKDRLEGRLELLERATEPVSRVPSGITRLFAGWQQEPTFPAMQSRHITQIWAHAALIYDLVTINGSLDPTNPDICAHIVKIMQIIDQKLTPPELLRMVAWPFCVAGCLAKPEQQSWFRRKGRDLEPPGLFVTVRKALEIMESTWVRMEAQEYSSLGNTNMASCFAATGEIIFLI
ncbi:hypothetical protein PV08_07902 [Exophiala spinifera]|uniref:Zn(2)-C6 fungal-type domain-containing protein n=1 Tax=Exophiala spinifera TaxID=91928 RepID=A0A0D2B8Y2_9EURO|nr:uncharacterized protein PV08_07902 [Exophiala spinifera]KIW15115.1 hypothetical protein PV08_07902 [Exophiala spinifera]